MTLADTPYFDRKILLNQFPEHVVAALETTFLRSGGTSIVILDQAEIEALLDGVLPVFKKVHKLEERLDELERAVEVLR